MSLARRGSLRADGSSDAGASSRYRLGAYRVGRFLAMCVAPFVLSSCCIFGFTESTTEEWESPFPGQTAEVKAMCEAEVRREADERKGHFREMVATECQQEKPFATREFVNPSTGVSYGVSLADRWANALCPDWRRDQTISDESLVRFCHGCFFDQSDRESCYKKNGLAEVRRTSVRCAPMKLF